jgi:hypothetical protein
MTDWIPNEQEMAAVLCLDGPARYRHSIKKIADFEQLWGLTANDGKWALMADDAHNQCMPVWPHENYARLLVINDWEHYTPQSISLDKWLTKWLSGMKRDRLRVAVFPTPNVSGVVVEPERMEADLKLELSAYE